jgi:hypothetical protein
MEMRQPKPMQRGVGVIGALLQMLTAMATAAGSGVGHSSPMGGKQLGWITVRFALVVSIALTVSTWREFASAQGQEMLAPSSGPLRALVWLEPETDEVLERIHGQTNDLNVDLLIESIDPIPNFMDAQLKAAYTLGEQRNVSLVVWFVRQRDSERHFIVHIAIPRAHRLLTRDLGPSNASSRNGVLSSVVSESAALVVRAAIQALLSGSTIGEVRAVPPSGLSELPTASTPALAPHVVANENAWHDATQSVGARARPQELPNWRTSRWAGGLNWLTAYDNSSEQKLAECASLHIKYRLQPVDLLVGGTVCLKRSVPSRYGAFSLGRQEAAIGANTVVLRTGLEVSLGVKTGAIFYERETGVAAVGVSQQPSSAYAIGTVGPQLRLLGPAQGTRVQAGLVLGFDVLSRPLSIGYTVDGNYIPTVRIYTVQPYLALGLALRL